MDDETQADIEDAVPGLGLNLPANALDHTITGTVTFTLSGNIEDLSLTGTNAINGTGNTLSIHLRGKRCAASAPIPCRLLSMI